MAIAKKILDDFMESDNRLDWIDVKSIGWFFNNVLMCLTVKEGHDFETGYQANPFLECVLCAPMKDIEVRLSIYGVCQTG